MSGSVYVSETLWNETAANSHIFGACVFVFGFTALFRRWWHPKWTMLVTFILLVVFALPKELWYDVNYETAAEAGQAWVDIVTYLAGGVLGLLLGCTQFPCYTHRKNTKTTGRKILRRRLGASLAM